MPGLALQFLELNSRTFKRKADMNTSRIPPKPSPRTRSSTTNSQNSAESWRKGQVRTEDRETCPDCDATCVSKHGTQQRCNQCGKQWGPTPEVGRGLTRADVLRLRLS